MTQDQGVLSHITNRVVSIKEQYEETMREREAGGSGSDAACELEDCVVSLLDIVEQLTELAEMID